MARGFTSEFGEGVGGRVVVKGGQTGCTVVEHPGVSTVMGTTVALHVGSHGFKAVGLPPHPSGTTVEKGHVSATKTKCFQGKAVRGDGVEFDVQPRSAAQIIREFLRIFVKRSIIILDRERDAENIILLVGPNASTKSCR